MGTVLDEISGYVNELDRELTTLTDRQETGLWNKAASSRLRGVIQKISNNRTRLKRELMRCDSADK